MTPVPRDTTQLPAPLASLHEARERASQVFVLLDTAGPLLDEPERGACIELRGQAADLIRRLGNLTAFLGGPVA